MSNKSEKYSYENRCIAILILNIVLFVLAIIGAVMSVANHNVTESLIYYTQDSNIFLGAASAVYAVFSIRSIRNKEYIIPSWVQKLKYLSVCCISVTFFVVLFILAPMAESLGGLKWILFNDSMLFQHFLSPLIGLLGFLILERRPPLPFRFTFFALIPTLVYAAVLYPLNIAGIVDGPYPFLQVHRMGAGMSVMWFFILFVFSYFLAWIVWFLHSHAFFNRMAAAKKEK